MTLNTVFANNYTSTVEQNLIEDLIIEAIQQKGILIQYLPRTYIAEDDLYGEDVLSKFENATEIEVWVETFDSMGGTETHFLSKFGFQISDQMNLIVSQKRFNDEFGKRPYEGDFIYFPLDKRMYQIKYVEYKSPAFYQLGENYVYRLSCELATYASERFETGNTIIDTLNWDEDYSIVLNLGSGSGTYTIEETVYQGSNLASANTTAKVVDYQSSNSILEVINVNGTFTANVNIIGNDSGASYTYEPIINAETDELTQDSMDSDNLELENEADKIINNSEANPFLDTEENI